jgi:hypothetical protein
MGPSRIRTKKISFNFFFPQRGFYKFIEAPLGKKEIYFKNYAKSALFYF